MCFHYAYIADKVKTAKRYNVDNPPEFDPVHHANAFGAPAMPAITNEEPSKITMLNWGLVPYWIKTAKDGDSISKKTANSRSETVFEKPSFRSAIVKRRCLIPATGFYEWRHEGKEKIPHFVSVKDQEIFSFAGIHEHWTDKETGEVRNTFSILTTAANELMSYVHNNRERMPVILKQEDEQYWLSPLKDKDEIRKAIYTYPTEQMQYEQIPTKDLRAWVKERFGK
jgi:putative SOS response-associated peptidase YedK